MSPRIAVELTSERPDGTWTWRAAGARQPKGVLDGKLLPANASVGDVLRAEADIDIEGITVTSVMAPKAARQEPERLQVIGSPTDDTAVTTSRVGAGRGAPRPIDRSDRAPGPRRSERPRPDRDRSERETSHRPRPGGSRPGGSGDGDRRPGGGETARHERRARPPRPEVAPRPKPRKLRPRRVHRDALLAELPQEQQAIAEQALRGGMPAVRAALEEQNAEARREGKPEAPSAAVLAIAEGLLPRVRVADWLDRADAALADAEELALADLRSVVVSAEDVAREEETREPAVKLRAVLERRTEVEQAVWQQDLEQSLQSGRVVRALRLSSRAPQPGERLAGDVATRLAEAAGAAMTAEIAVDRWATLLDAVAYSAVRRSVTPAGVPPEPGDDLLGQVRKHAGRVPTIAGLFGIEPVAPKGSRRAPRRRAPVAAGSAPSGPPPPPGSLGPRARRIPPPPAPASEVPPAPATGSTSETTPQPAPAPELSPESAPPPAPAPDVPPESALAAAPMSESAPPAPEVPPEPVVTLEDQPVATERPEPEPEPQ